MNILEITNVGRKDGYICVRKDSEFGVRYDSMGHYWFWCYKNGVPIVTSKKLKVEAHMENLKNLGNNWYVRSISHIKPINQWVISNQNKSKEKIK